MLTHQDTKVALGSRVYLTLVTNADKATVEQYFDTLWQTLSDFEKRCSRFLPASELSHFNRAAGLRQPITPEFRDVLLAAKHMSEISGGLYNPFILPALQRAGYVKSMVTKHSEDITDDFSNRSIATPDKLEIGDNWASIPYGTAIDLGGCGKGYIGDMLADIADTFPEVCGYWFSLGGDVVTGGLDKDGNPWKIQIESASNPEGTAATVVLPGTERYAVATSIPIRSAPKIGREHVHIIDPRTKQPVKADIALATVCVQKAILADVLASCVIITGKAHAKAYLSKKNIVGAFLQIENQKPIRIGSLIHIASTSASSTTA